MQKLESRGLVLFNRNYRENDKLVKIFTEQAGKRMFFVRGGGAGKLSAVIQPLTIAEFMMTVNDVGLPFDFSYKYSGLLCPNHYTEDERRSHLDPNVPYLLDRFQGLSFKELRSISVKDDMKRKLRQFIDELYDNYVGIHLKSKKFIDNLNSWAHIMDKEDSAD